jgi:serine/threonine-protein kinase
VPPGGAIEGETGYTCDGGGDCHLIVIDTEGCRLFEMWRAIGGCHAVWDLNADYDPTLRGDCCTSADAAGLPIAAHMFSADEIAAGEINHAIRFILPNANMRALIYVRRATHSTGATSGPASAPPYGARLRLKASFDESSMNSAAQVVARALKRYGMILSDGGNITFTATNDRFTTNKWVDVGLGPHDLTGHLSWTDFEVPELGQRFTWDGNCNCSRTPITE